MSEHDLKCWPEPFQAIWNGRKWFEYRKDDRGFKVGDVLRLHEGKIEMKTWKYSGRIVERVVTYILGCGFGLPAGFVVLSLDGVEQSREEMYAELTSLRSKVAELEAQIETARQHNADDCEAVNVAEAELAASEAKVSGLREALDQIRAECYGMRQMSKVLDLAVTALAYLAPTAEESQPSSGVINTKPWQPGDDMTVSQEPRP